MSRHTAADSIQSWLISHPGVTDIDHVEKLTLTDVDLVASITNQSRFDPIDEPTVERYVAALQDGALFPAVIVRRIAGARADGDDQLVILGGNHRARAHRDAGRKHLEAFVITCDDLTALEIAYGDNATHGLPPSEAERLAHALVLVDRGRSAADAARTVGIDPQRVTRRLAVVGVDKRAARCGVALELTKVGDTVRPRLASLRDDRVFTKFIRTLATEGIPTQDALKIIGDLNTQPTAQAAIDLLAIHVQEHRATTRVGRTAGRPSENPYLQLRTALGTIRHLNAADVIDAVRTDRELQDLARLCKDGARHLMAIDKLAHVEHREGAA